MRPELRPRQQFPKNLAIVLRNGKQLAASFCGGGSGARFYSNIADVTPRSERREQLIACLVLFVSLLIPAQASVAFLVQGCWAVFGGQLFGFPAMGIEPSTGASAARTGTFLILFGLLSALIAFFGLRYSLRLLRKNFPRRG